MVQAPKGRVPVNVVYTGGLRNARERELVVATLCKDVLAWMTAHPRGDLRLVVYIDEVAGLCPPHPRNPPAKKFLSLLFRQARKYGVGVIVATQNVTDLDYKALGQASTWALGRLMAKQDLDRVRHVVASVHAGPTDSVLAKIPALRAGEFILLSPDNSRSAAWRRGTRSSRKRNSGRFRRPGPFPSRIRRRASARPVGDERPPRRPGPRRRSTRSTSRRESACGSSASSMTDRGCTVRRRSARRSWSTAGSLRSSCGSWQSIACSASSVSMAGRCIGTRRSDSIRAGARRSDSPGSRFASR